MKNAFAAGIAGVVLAVAVAPMAAQAPADGAVLEKNIPIKVTEVAPGLVAPSSRMNTRSFPRG